MFDEKQVDLQTRILEFEEHSTRILERILHILEHRLPHPHHRVTAFTISQIGDSTMALQPLAPGFSPQFTATPVPAGVVLNPALPVPSWTSSDTVNAPVSVDSTGLIATVAIPATAVVGTSVTLSVAYTNGDSTTATGTLTFSIVAAPPADVTSFTIAQTA